MTTTKGIELVFFEGCPNVGRTRDRLRAALEAAGREPSWTEWDLMAADAPERVRRYASPTVLVDGADVAGGDETDDALSCRAGGAPSAEVIRRALEGHGH